MEGGDGELFPKCCWSIAKDSTKKDSRVKGMGRDQMPGERGRGSAALP